MVPNNGTLQVMVALPGIQAVSLLSRTEWNTCHLGMYAVWDPSHIAKNALPALPRLRSRAHFPYVHRLLTILS